ncbi:MAG: hypothetical protein MUO24_02285 [Desulfobacterales bacterium]|nr:hypothetical protein [Desulfobacterales bacterium]
MKIEFTGWVGKDETLEQVKQRMYLDCVHSVEGARGRWEERDFPPREIKITLEDIDEKD